MPFADEVLQAAMLAPVPLTDDLAPLRAADRGCGAASIIEEQGGDRQEG